MLASAVAGWVYAANKLDATPVAGLAPVPSDGPVNTLVIHSDSLEGTVLVSLAVVQTDAARDAPVVLQLPLDLEVTVPGAGTATLEAAFRDGGSDRLVAAVTDYTGIDLHNAFHVSLSGLEELAAALDPTTCSAACVTDQLDALRATGGPSFEDVRTHADLLATLAAETARPGLLFSPFQAKRVVDALPRALRMNEELGPREARNRAGAFAAADLTDLDVRTVPGFHDPGLGRTRVYPEQAETLFQAVRDGTALPSELGLVDPRDDLLTPGSVRVLVLNGVGLGGLAGGVADTLEAAGFDVAGAENADEFDDDLDVTVVRHRPDRAHEGELLRDVLEGASLEVAGDLPRGIDVVVVVGRDRAGR